MWGYPAQPGSRGGRAACVSIEALEAESGGAPYMLLPPLPKRQVWVTAGSPCWGQGTEMGSGPPITVQLVPRGSGRGEAVGDSQLMGAGQELGGAAREAAEGSWGQVWGPPKGTGTQTETGGCCARKCQRPARQVEGAEGEEFARRSHSPCSNIQTD